VAFETVQVILASILFLGICFTLCAMAIRALVMAYFRRRVEKQRQELVRRLDKFRAVLRLEAKQLESMGEDLDVPAFIRRRKSGFVVKGQLPDYPVKKRGK